MRKIILENIPDKCVDCNNKHLFSSVYQCNIFPNHVFNADTLPCQSCVDATVKNDNEDDNCPIELKDQPNLNYNDAIEWMEKFYDVSTKELAVPSNILDESNKDSTMKNMNCLLK
jgi:hypothetical protein